MKVLINRLFEQDNIFKPASKSDIETRDTEKIQIWIKDFEQRSDVKKNKDGSYDVDGDVDLSTMNWTKLPVKFGTVGEDFWCNHNQLTSLEGGPETVDGSFYCSYNQLTSLEGSPETVGGDFDCRRNKKKFTVEEVKKVCNVKGKIYV